MCRVCRAEVPAGTFCGVCGAYLDPQRHDTGWLRPRAYCAGREHLLWPSVVSSLFPVLPHRSRARYRLGIAALVVAMLACTLLRVPAAITALAAFGLPLLFVTYLRESAVIQNLSARTLLLTGALGAGLGTTWALLTGTAVAREYDMPMGVDVPEFRVMRDGLAVPLGALLLLLTPCW